MVKSSSPDRVLLRAGEEPTGVVLHEADLDEVRGQLVDEAVARARAEGHAAGRIQGHDEAVQAAAGALNVAVDQLEAWRDETAGKLSSTAVELGIAVARQLLKRDIELGNWDVERVVRDTLHAASTERKPCVVHLHPEDLEALRDVPFRAATELQADYGIARGDVHVTSHLGLVVREVEGLLDSIAERLREEIS